MGLVDFFSPVARVDKALSIAEKGLDGAISGIDKLIFTEEEKTEAGQKVIDAHLRLMELLAGENTARSITRRLIAVMVTGVFLSLLVFGAGIHHFYPEWAAYVLTCAGSLSDVVLAIAVFYFGPYQIGNALRNAKK